jgi:hypothetical protein
MMLYPLQRLYKANRSAMLLSYLTLTENETHKKIFGHGISSRMIEIPRVVQPTGQVKHVRRNILKLQLFKQDTDPRLF